MIASGKSARIVNGGNGVGSAQSAKRLRVGHRGHHGTRLKAGNASQRRKTSPVRQERTSGLRRSLARSGLTLSPHCRLPSHAQH